MYHVVKIYGQKDNTENKLAAKIMLPMENIYAAFFTGEDDQLLNLELNKEPEKVIAIPHSRNFFNTRTDVIPDMYITNAEQTKILEIQDKLFEFCAVRNYVFDDTKAAYHEFKVPKKSGGFRTIAAPHEDLKELQYKILNFFRDTLKTFAHDSAYAYVPGRSTKDCLLAHQANQSRWFLKLDIKDFFGSCNADFVLETLCSIYPFNKLNKDRLRYILKACMLDNALPQGAITSPHLSNLIMIPFDYAMVDEFKKNGFVYTRYADDIILSHRFAIDKEKVIARVQELLKDTPFRLNEEKTRYGSNAGRNWNLGLMLNKDNNITIGYKTKQRLKSGIHSFMMDAKQKHTWDGNDTMHLIGMVSYFKNIEPEYAQYVLDKAAIKAGITWQAAVNYHCNLY